MKAVSISEFLSAAPDGTRIVLTEELRDDGSTCIIRARRPTDEDLPTMTSPNEQEAGRSGSSNSHARLSPSASERWSACTASIALEQEHAEAVFLADVDRVIRLTPYLESIPDELHEHEKRAIGTARRIIRGEFDIKNLSGSLVDDIRKTESSVAAREGTRAHDFAEAVLNGRRSLDSVPEEFRHHVGSYTDYVLSLVPAGELPYVEAKVPLFYSPEETGTVDFAVVTPEAVKICDLKYGQGKLVYPVENTQLAIYALSLVRHHQEEGLIDFQPDTRVEIHVYQPRHHEAAGLKPWILTLKDLEDFCAVIGERAAHVRRGEGLVFAPSDPTCMFCKVKGRCEARLTALADMLDNPDAGYTHADLLAELPSDDEIPDMEKKEFRALPVKERLISRVEFATNGRTGLLPDDIAVALFENRAAIAAFLDDVAEDLSARYLGGEKIPGLKPVLGRPGNREWADEDAADTFLKGQGLKEADRYDRKLKSPTKAGEMLADKLEASVRTRNRFEALVTRSTPKVVIVPESDKREAVSLALDELPHEDEDDGLGEMN